MRSSGTIFSRRGSSLKRLGDILNAPTEPSYNANRTSLRSIKGTVTFDNVTFRYRPDGKEVLRRVDLTVEAGQVLGIVGPSGSGKSTLTKLVQRMYVPESGRVLVDGVDLSMVDTAWLRHQVGVVLQENLLFNRTIRENIALADPGMPMDRVIAAAELAGAHEFILELPEGYDTLVEERGHNLSGGQRQRIAIARALVTNPRIFDPGRGDECARLRIRTDHPTEHAQDLPWSDGDDHRAPAQHRPQRGPDHHRRPWRGGRGRNPRGPFAGGWALREALPSAIGGGCGCRRVTRAPSDRTPATHRAKAEPQSAAPARSAERTGDAAGGARRAGDWGKDEREFLPAALEVLETPASPAARWTAIALAAFFSIAVAWSLIGTVDVVAVAQGRIVPTGGIKQIQPLEIGVVRAIHVSDGMAVRKGDILVELDPTDSEVDKGQLQQELMAAAVELARLHAMTRRLDGVETPLRAPDGADPVLVTMQRQRLDSDIAAHEAEMASMEAQLDSRIAERRSILAEIEKLKQTLPLIEEREQSLASLVEKGVRPEAELA